MFLLPSRMMLIHPKMKALECSQHFSQYKSMGHSLHTLGQVPPLSLVGSCWISNPVWDFMVEWSQDFPRYNSMGVMCCHGHQSFYPIWSQIFCSLSPTPIMLQMKFYLNMAASFRDIYIWKCKRTGRQMDAGLSPILQAPAEPSAQLS